MEVLWGIIKLQSRLMEVWSDTRGFVMKRLVIGIVLICLILLAMWFLTTGSPG